MKSSSPASSGPAGHYFEASVSAFYMLSMLTGAEPRGLPFTCIDRIKLQRAAEGYPLDDVIVHAHSFDGKPAILEIQVKRTISFSPKDEIFQKVVKQIFKASQKSEFETSRYELAIATSQTSRQIDGAYQDVLRWARELGDAQTFMARINRPGSSSPAIRTFVDTFRSNLILAGAPADDVTVWRLLRKLQILIFDFNATGSATAKLIKERAVPLLHPEDSHRAENLLTTLKALSLQIAADGGDRNRTELIEELMQQSFRFSGQQNYTFARDVLTEASNNALADINDRIGDITLTRQERLASIRNAFDIGRYIEIRGETGVGKSALLKHFAEQVAIEGRVIVLNPDRTLPGGWAAMRAALKFSGTARDLLQDLASQGGSVIFIDNLDFFNKESRTLVSDLLLAAADVPGIFVLATARSNFGKDEQNWLPQRAIKTLGIAEPIWLDELNETEIEEIKFAIPNLAPLLTNTHPAREVVRNLFRLAYFAKQPEDAKIPLSEVEMAQHWYNTADGISLENKREAKRLLRNLSEKALGSTRIMNVIEYSPKIVDELIRSDVLRDLGNDRVTYRHDVFREWSIANFLYSDPSKINLLRLDLTAAPDHARGIELASRMFIETSTDFESWKSWFDQLSKNGVHGTWRRAVLLGLVRSEVAHQLLPQASDFLLADDGVILSELLRVMMAVEVLPASQVFINYGVPLEKIPKDLNVPVKPSWLNLIPWLLEIERDLPQAVIPDVISFYVTWCEGLLGNSIYTPLVLKSLYRWLHQIERIRRYENLGEKQKIFGSELDRNNSEIIELNLRNVFLLYCDQVPELALEYLESLCGRQANDDAIINILKCPGVLAQCAPAALARLTETTLIQSNSEASDSLRAFSTPFSSHEYIFFTPSPLKGPFLELLTYAPEYGLPLIHHIVDHGLSFNSENENAAENQLEITFQEEKRIFPYKHSYGWSRGWGKYNTLASALMALEVWAHRRIENGDPFQNVLKDVLGPIGSSSAFLLVAVDLLISHWPTSSAFAIPFLTCPELLILDRSRKFHENLRSPDNFSYTNSQDNALHKDALNNLNNRSSRQFMLSDLIGLFAVSEMHDLREILRMKLQDLNVALGKPDETMNLHNPVLMIEHALNLINPVNWRVQVDDGTKESYTEYLQPEAEKQHLQAVKKNMELHYEDYNMESSIRSAIQEPTTSSPEFAKKIVAWVKNASISSNGAPIQNVSTHIIVLVAIIAIRDGDKKFRIQTAPWAQDVFRNAVANEAHPTNTFNDNTIAYAFIGFVYLLKNNLSTDFRDLLEAAATGNPRVVHGFREASRLLATIDERLPCSLLRCAFAACIRQKHISFDMIKEAASQVNHTQESNQSSVEAELSWLANEDVEPDWPIFPSTSPRIKRVGESEQNFSLSEINQAHLDQKTAALWLYSVQPHIDILNRSWIWDLIEAYASWTVEINGHEELSMQEWNEAYFYHLAQFLPQLKPNEIETFCVKPLCAFSDEAFLHIIPSFLRNIDNIIFSNTQVYPLIIGLRTALSARLMTCKQWKRLMGKDSHSIETRLARAIAAFFFNDRILYEDPKCYLYPKAMDKLDEFIPMLEGMVASAPSVFIAYVLLNLLEVSPKAAHLPLMVESANIWLKRFPNDTPFWIDHQIGARICRWIEAVHQQCSAILLTDQKLRTDVDLLLTKLICLGVSEASHLEKTVSLNQNDASALQ